ncbi:MAG: SAM-dependent methyltransferase [Sediminibacterium sp. Gen4]|jgi:16S rRNA (cytidine1402-2'-O)-methyltransferase|uniref:SAM-dependent methyltransferase n=1 Tax=unclassified Sediminibacterium TaxID=2635961 RepID=UPI0015BB98E2|nr:MULTISPECIES: SAM-dependent methyltransferase [unclassified Sediminibacterium]MBW0162732.1 SAM-dependent methyltransferase [Sediminibacterium sp.]MBW0164840.1 SAM-dependent methyltransferase [Sediminibacterium sp.]NWK65647.1 SAM-dependent methyltransferase [Sediminibacterium sp. Gen4]
MQFGKLYLIPTVLYEDAIETIPPYILDAVKDCSVFFVEQEKTARRFLKKLWREMIIDDYQWFAIHKAEAEVKQTFIQLLQTGKNIGIISEAGCPGIADPGQILVEAAQNIGVTVKPLVGPSSILLALMASGMNGQCFQFHGYLPIDGTERKKKIRELEADSSKRNCTQLFIETPYRNNALMNDLLQSCKQETKLCIAVDITATTESIKTKTIRQWKQDQPDIHKRLAIFLLQA